MPIGRISDQIGKEQGVGKETVKRAGAFATGGRTTQSLRLFLPVRYAEKTTKTGLQKATKKLPEIEKATEKRQELEKVKSLEPLKLKELRKTARVGGSDFWD